MKKKRLETNEILIFQLKVWQKIQPVGHFYKNSKLKGLTLHTYLNWHLYTIYYVFFFLQFFFYLELTFWVWLAQKVNSWFIEKFTPNYWWNAILLISTRNWDTKDITLIFFFFKKRDLPQLKILNQWIFLLKTSGKFGYQQFAKILNLIVDNMIGFCKKL